jgi:ABC-type dipeptide/oligopeptide/nickel transport system permease component
MAKHSTGKIIGQRILGAIPSVIGVVIVTFLLTRALPGIRRRSLPAPPPPPRPSRKCAAAWGWIRPCWSSFSLHRRPVSGRSGGFADHGADGGYDLMTRLPASLELTLAGLVFAIALALPLGILAATRPNSWIDHGVRLLATAGSVSAHLLYRVVSDLCALLPAGHCPGSPGAVGYSLQFSAPDHRLLY